MLIIKRKLYAILLLNIGLDIDANNSEISSCTWFNNMIQQHANNKETRMTTSTEAQLKTLKALKFTPLPHR